MSGPARVVAVLSGYRPNRRRWGTWVHQEPVLAGQSWEGLHAELMDRDTSMDRKDDLLAALVRIAGWDPDAVVALAVCLLPGLRARARRLVPALGDTDEAWGEILAGLCARIASYDLERRPRRIAANLTMDAILPLRRSVRRHLRWSEATCGLVPSQHRVEPDGLPAQVILSLAADAGVIAPVDAALISATRLGGLTIREAAGLLGMNLELAKKRRQRAEPALVAWWWLHDDTPPEHPTRLAPVITLRPPTRAARSAAARRAQAPAAPPGGHTDPGG